MTVDGKQYTVKLTDNKTATALLDVLPFETSASEYHSNHYYGTTPKALSVDGVPTTKYAKKGHLIYSDQFKGLGLFFADGHFDEYDLVYLGEVIEDISALDGSHKQVKIKLEKAAND